MMDEARYFDIDGVELFVRDWVQPAHFPKGQRWIIGFHGNLVLLSCGLCIRADKLKFLREGS